ncbi:MAG: hypothetical protein ACK476_03520, partial [Fluviicola sp.]
IELKDDGYLISYDNFESSWNEVVGTDRLKPIENVDKSSFSKETITTTTSSTSTNTMEAKVSEMCACEKNSAKTGKLADKEKCLDLNDVHLATFEEGGEDYYTYKRLVFECKQEALNVKIAPEGSFEKYKKEVCDCFEKNKSNKSLIMNCYKLQNDYSNQMGSEDERVKFIQETNSCIKSN